MAFWHRIGNSKLKAACFQFRRCYTHLSHASLSNSTPKTCPTVMPNPHSLFHDRPTIFLNSVRFYAVPVQVKLQAFTNWDLFICFIHVGWVGPFWSFSSFGFGSLDLLCCCWWCFYGISFQFQVKPKNEEDDTDGPRLNDQIKARQVRLVVDGGKPPWLYILINFSLVAYFCYILSWFASITVCLILLLGLVFVKSCPWRISCQITDKLTANSWYRMFENWI